MPRGSRFLAHALPLLVLVPVLPSCTLFADLFCPAQEAVNAPSFETPEATFLSFQRALGGNNERYEYNCLSGHLLDRFDIDYPKYVIGRRRFLRANRQDVELFKSAKIADVRYEVSEEGHELAHVILSAKEREVTFVLINEPYYEIAIKRDREEPEYPWGAVEDFPSRFRIENGELHVRIPLEQAPTFALDSIAGLEIKNEWKVLHFLDIGQYLIDSDGPARSEPPQS